MARQDGFVRGRGRLRRARIALALMVGTAGAVCALTPAIAQNATAALRGHITDAGQPTGTAVTAVEVDTGYRALSPITAGNYNFPSLRPGRYRLEVATPGGTRQTDVFTLRVGQNAVLDFDLAQPNAGATPAAAQPSPNVPQGATTSPAASAAPAQGNQIIVTGSNLRTLDGGEVGANITQHTIETLPQNNRNFLAFADLAPGVQFITDANGNQHLQGGAQPDNAINVFIDGVGQKDYVLAGGIVGQDSSNGNPFPQLGIAEYRVISQNYKAEFDQVSSAAITAITKSGTNEFHGDAFFDFSNQALRAKTPQEEHDDIAKVDTKDEQFGASLGGPIIKDVMHFFVTYEGKRQTFPVDIFPGGGVPVSSVPAPYNSAFGNFNRTFNEDLYFGKIDFSPSTSDLVELSSTIRRERGLDWSDGQNARSFTTNIHNDTTEVLLHYQHSGDFYVNDARLSYDNSAWAPTPNGGQGDAYNLQLPNGTTILNYGPGLNYQNKGQRVVALQDDFTYTGVAHNTFKTGFEARFIRLSTLQRTPYNPYYFFDTANPSVSGFNDSLPYMLQFGVPVAGSSGGAVRASDFQLGLYAQDDWAVTPRLTLNLGLRWDYERDSAYLDYVTPPAVVAALSGWSNIQNTDYNYRDYISTGHNRHPFLGEFQPRLGFTYDLSEDGRFQLFGGYGRSYNRDQFDYISLEQLQGSYKTVTFNFQTNDPNHPCPVGSNCIAWNPAYLTQAGRDMLSTGANDGGREVDLINNDLKVPYSDQFSLGTRGRFGRLHAEIGYTHVLSRDGFAFLLGNRTPGGTFFQPGTTWQSPFGYPVPGYGSLILGTNGIKTDSNSVYLQLTKDYTKSSPWSMDVTYTFTAANENRAYGEHYSLDYPSLADYPVLTSVGVPRQRVVATGSVDLPLGLELSGKLLLQSPPYVYGICYSDPSHTPTHEQPCVTQGRNTNAFILGDWWATRQLDLALTKFVPLDGLYHGARLRLRVDVFNIFNTANFTAYNGDGTSPNFGQLVPYSTGGYPPRTLKLTAGFSF